MRHLLCLMLFVALLSPAWAQQAGHSNARIDKVQRQQRSQLSDKKSFRVSYQPTPDPIPLNAHFRLRLQLQDAKNRMLKGAKLTVQATMPEHNHGMNVKPQVRDLGNGLFEVRGLLFHMPGYWEVAATVMHQGKRETVVFGITVSPRVLQDHAGHH